MSLYTLITENNRDSGRAGSLTYYRPILIVTCFSSMQQIRKKKLEESWIAENRTQWKNLEAKGKKCEAQDARALAFEGFSVQ